MSDYDKFWYYAMRKLNFLAIMATQGLDAALAIDTELSALSLTDDEKATITNLLNSSCLINGKWITGLEIYMIYASNFVGYIGQVDTAKTGTPPPPPPPFKALNYGSVVKPETY